MKKPAVVGHIACLLLSLAPVLSPVSAQTPPNAVELETYDGLFQMVAAGDGAAVARALDAGADPNQRDGHGRTPLHLATYLSRHDAMRLLAAAGGDANALENDAYDIVTIAAVADDLESLRVALKIGCRATNVTSPYDGTALIAAAHLGHVEVVRELIAAGAPLDHVNNLAWTAVIEAIVLGDGGRRHRETLQALVDAGANVNLADGQGASPLVLARARGYRAMEKILRAAGAK